MQNSAVNLEERSPKTPLTLGDILYAGSKASVPEQEWVALIQEIAIGNQLALHAIYERAHGMVFTLAVRITANRETAEELMIDVFYDIWRRAPHYDAANGTVLGWIMNQTRSRAIDRLRFESRIKRRHRGHIQSLTEVAASPEEVVNFREQSQALRSALALLTKNEREAIETTFFAELTYAEAAARLNEPLGTIKTRIRSGLHKLHERLVAEAEKS